MKKWDEVHKLINGGSTIKYTCGKLDMKYNTIYSHLKKNDIPFAKELIDLSEHEKKIYSQNGEDGMIDTIFKNIKTKNKYYVEFGVEDGKECNTRFLREKGWAGLMLDGSNENKNINLQKHFITKDNIVQLFKKYSVPKVFDFLSVDIDYNDLYVLYEILKKYRPVVICVEYNSYIYKDAVVVYDSNNMWDKTKYFGASICAFNKLFQEYGYNLIGGNNVNIFAIDNSLKTDIKFKYTNRPEKIYKRLNGYHLDDYHHRKFMVYEKAIKLMDISNEISNNIRDLNINMDRYIKAKKDKKWDKKYEKELVNLINGKLDKNPLNIILIKNYLSTL
jgi:hypothetical protein